jgi:hypothetical protein
VRLSRVKPRICLRLPRTSPPAHFSVDTRRLLAKPEPVGIRVDGDCLEFDAAERVLRTDREDDHERGNAA